jgi:hypothetical protein
MRNLRNCKDNSTVGQDNSGEIILQTRQKYGIVITGVQGHHKAQTFFEDTKSSHGVAEPAPIGVQMITRHKGDQAPYMMERRSRPKDSKLSGQNPG